MPVISDGPNNNFYNAALVGTQYNADSCPFQAPLPDDKQFAKFYVTTIDENNQESKPYINWPLKLEAVKDQGSGLDHEIGLPAFLFFITLPPAGIGNPIQNPSAYYYARL